MSSVLDPIKQAIQQALVELDISIQEIPFEHPANAEHGDWSTPVALMAFKQLEDKSRFSSPRALAEYIKEQFQKQIPDRIGNDEQRSLHVGRDDNSVSKVEVAGPGFINFYLHPSTFMDEIDQILQSKTVDHPQFAGKQITTEFTDPNPFKEFHIGHLYSNTVGESLSRLFAALGAQVRRVCYQGDVGMHVAKSVWGIINLLKDPEMDLADQQTYAQIFAKMQQMSDLPLSERANFMGKSYAAGAMVYEDDPKAAEQIKQLNKQIFSRDAKLVDIYDLGRAWSLEYFENIYQRLGTKFQGYYFESMVGKTGEQIVRENLAKGIFEESQGAIIFPGSKHGLHDRVFINSLGLPTYEAKELGLAPAKYEDHAYDESFIVTGKEINEYFKVLLKAMSLIFPELAAKTTHIGHGMVRLPEGKMSSRKGNVLTGESLIDLAKDKILEILAGTKPDVDTDKREEIAEAVSIAAIKYTLLKNNIGADVTFNINESISFEGNSGPYLLYTYARGKSVLRKAENHSGNVIPTVVEASLSPTETSLLRHLAQFHEVVTRAGTELAPHLLCNYLYELASLYNSFYNSHRILNAEDDQIRDFRLYLTQATTTILDKGIQLLGFKTIEEM